MTRGWKLAIGIGGGVVALNVLLQAVGSLTGGVPGGPRSSAYATGKDGLAAYEALLTRSGHRVLRARTVPSKTGLDAGDTVVLLDPDLVSEEDAAALRTFVEGGGRVIAGGQPTGWLAALVDSPPRWSPEGAGSSSVLAPVPEVAGVDRVKTAGEGSWDGTGSALPAFGGRDRSLVDVAAVGRGRVALLADPSPLQNRLLADADNAALGLALAGPASRRVVFLESYHGYGESSGVSAIPGPFMAALVLGIVAALVFMLSRVRRLGPPELEARELPPPRQEYVDSLGGVLSRTRAKTRAEGVEPVRRRARRLLAGRGALGPDATDDELRGAGRLLELPDDEVEAIFGPGSTEASVVLLGAALARLERESAMVRR